MTIKVKDFLVGFVFGVVGLWCFLYWIAGAI